MIVHPVTEGEMEEARKALALGKSLEQAADLLGLEAHELDLLLWERGGALAKSHRRVRAPRFETPATYLHWVA